MSPPFPLFSADSIDSDPSTPTKAIEMKSPKVFFSSFVMYVMLFYALCTYITLSVTHVVTTDDPNFGAMCV